MLIFVLRFNWFYSKNNNEIAKIGGPVTNEGIVLVEDSVENWRKIIKEIKYTLTIEQLTEEHLSFQMNFQK